MPKPKPNESEAEYVARYMSSEEAKRKFPDEKQRLAVAYSEYKRKKKDFEFHVKAPISRYWEEEVISKSGEKGNSQRFMEVTVSGLKEDRQGEIMSISAIKKMIDQFKSGTIPFFPDHGRDEITGQPNVYSWKQMMGVWVDARSENDKLMAVVRLNKAHPDHEQLWNYVKEEMPIAFSIGGKAVDEPKYIEIENDVQPEIVKEKNEESKNVG